jgi:TetR/AcrR family transcriptional regulator
MIMNDLESHADFKEQNRDRWKSQIIKVAALAFRKKGYHGTTMDDIAKKLKITKGSLYYYFKNKEAILFDCHTASLDIVEQVIEEVRTTDLSPSEKIHSVVYHYLGKMLDKLLGSVLLLEEESLSPNLLKQIIKRRDGVEQFMRRTIEEGIGVGEFQDGDPKLLAFAILGAINWSPKWYNPSGDKSASEIAREFADYLVRGLRKESVMPLADVKIKTNKIRPGARISGPDRKALKK